MKLSLLLIIIIGTLSACKNQQQKDAEKLMGQIQATAKQNTPGFITTSENAYWMTAKMNGKDWKATSMMPAEAAGRIIGYYNDESISLPYDRRDMVVGKKNKFGENNAVDLFTNDDVKIWGGRKGEMEITKVDDNWAEGKFYVSASDGESGKTLEITDGFFRISLSKK